ncbi:permease [Heliomicrobium undosum]|nr:permease [Heliomicrobium undosum]
MKQYRWSFALFLLIVLLYLFDQQLGRDAFFITYDNLEQMLALVPPIFILMGLLDVWIPKETLIRYMGPGSSYRGLAIAFLLGTAAAGPLYVAFPLAILLLKKGARLANVVFFLGVWSSTKLPIVLFEIASFGLTFTVIHIGISIPAYLATAYLIEKMVSDTELRGIIQKAEVA